MAASTTFQEQLEKISKSPGFLAALDQSGGSTPKALRLYGIPDSDYVQNETSMFDKVHEMRTRIICSPSFNGDRILGAILFEDTMNRTIQDIPVPKFLWEEKNVVPLLKVDKGLAEEKDGVQVMKPMPSLDELLKSGKEKGIFGTKMRSVVKMANADGIQAVIDQQFEIGKRIVDAGLVPILEPEVDINSPEKAEAEVLVKKFILEHLEKLKGEEGDKKIMLKLTIPTVDNFYKELVDHESVVRVVALSGGYSREEANERLGRQEGMIASFSRALTEGMSAKDSDEEFDSKLDTSIGSIFDASST